MALCYVVYCVVLYVYGYCVIVYVIARERDSLSLVACRVVEWLGGWRACVLMRPLCVDVPFVRGGSSAVGCHAVGRVWCAWVLVCLGVSTMRLTCYA